MTFDWVALGIAAETGSRYLAVWRRDGSETASLPLPTLKGRTDIKGIICIQNRLQRMRLGALLMQPSQCNCHLLSAPVFFIFTSRSEL